MERFADEFFDRENCYSLGRDIEQGVPYLSIPVSNGHFDYEEYFSVTDSEYTSLKANGQHAIKFADACRNRIEDERLILQPGTNRGEPRQVSIIKISSLPKEFDARGIRRDIWSIGADKDEAMEFYRTLVATRMSDTEGFAHYAHASKELEKIDAAITGGTLDLALIRSLTSGVMCARELEDLDPEFCRAYFMMMGFICEMAGVEAHELY